MNQTLNKKVILLVLCRVVDVIMRILLRYFERDMQNGNAFEQITQNFIEVLKLANSKIDVTLFLKVVFETEQVTEYSAEL